MLSKSIHLVVAASILSLASAGHVSAKSQAHVAIDAAIAERLLHAVTTACGDVPLRSSTTTQEGGGTATLGLSRLLKSLADVGFSLSGKLSHEQSTGIPKEGLAQAFVARENCIPNTLRFMAAHTIVRIEANGKAVPPAVIRQVASTPQVSQAPPENGQKIDQGGSYNQQTVVQGNGNYIAAPVTPDQKVQAAAELTAHLEDLSQFPNSVVKEAAPTKFEQRWVNSPAYNLYSLLRTYNRDTIRSLPKGGDALIKFEHDYYTFEDKQISIENQLSSEVGRALKINNLDWLQIADYCLVRSMEIGLTPENATEKSWTFFVTPLGTAESVCSTIKGTEVGKTMSTQDSSFRQLLTDADQVLLEFK